MVLSSIGTAGVPVKRGARFSMDSGYLVVQTLAPAPNGGAPDSTKVVYQRYERGFGG